jgi:hypothetical protein
MRPLYTNRYGYIKRLRDEKPSRLEIFRDAQEVTDLAKKQFVAHQQAMTAKPGWQKAMQDAGIWDDDKRW